jgi:hypothetical protein
MDADLVPGANTLALVANDSTPANNGLYRKVGATTTGSWTKMLDFIPGGQLVYAVDSGAGTANAIQATSSLPVSETNGACLVIVTIFEANTASPVTISLNGATALTVKTVSGSNLPVGAFQADAVVLGYKVGTNFQLISDAANMAAIDASVIAAAASASAAAGSASAASTSASDAATQVGLATTQVGLATTQAQLAQGAANEAQAVNSIYPTTAAALGDGIVGHGTITGGSGGTNGTFTGTLTGGTGSGGAFTFTVAGGALTSIQIRAPGSYTVAPSFVFSASAGLTGASASVTLGQNVLPGRYFAVPSPLVTEALIIYENVAGVATERKRTPSSVTESERVSRDLWISGMALKAANDPRPIALINIAVLSQSNDEPREAANLLGFAPINVRMFTVGRGRPDYTFNPTNQQFPFKWSDVATAVQYEAKGNTESPGDGLAMRCLGGVIRRCYNVSVAIGAQGLPILLQSGPWSNHQAAVMRLCALAKADGYRPIVTYRITHGEAAMSGALTEAEYYAQLMIGVPALRQMAAACMNDPSYVAPFFVTQPNQSLASPHTTRAIIDAIERFAVENARFYVWTPMYSFGMDSDRVHQTPVGNVYRGELLGEVIKDLFNRGREPHGIRAVDATLSGSTVTLRYSEPVFYDTGVNYADNLNAGVQFAGFQHFDNGTPIAINALTVAGDKATITLASTPSGTIAQQEIRYAMHEVTATLTAGTNNLPSGKIRSPDAAVTSFYDGASLRRWALRQIIRFR